MLKKTIVFTGIFWWLLMMAVIIVNAQTKLGTVVIHFSHTANQQPLQFNDSVYANDFGERYTISKLKYYVGAFKLDEKNLSLGFDKYVLVDANQTENKIIAQLPEGNYHSIQFKLGVDSTDNCSGAQTGALDPLNSMFWTWNSGYIFLKLEGNSSASTAPDGRIEHHIGGYKDSMNVASTIRLADNIAIEAGKAKDIYISFNLDRYWNAASKIKIKETPVCMSPGFLAKTIAANFNAIFSIGSKTITY